MCHIDQHRPTAAETFRMPRSCWENSPSQMPILRHMTDSELENSALRCSAEVLQRLRPCRDSVPQGKKTAAPDWAPCPAFAACSFDGKRRCARGSSSYLVGRRMSGGSGSQTGAPSAALCLQDLRISRLHTQWRSQNIFTGGGGGRVRPLPTQGWHANLPLLRLQCAVDQDVVVMFLVINSFILDRLQCSHTTKTCVKKFVVYYTVVFLKIQEGNCRLLKL